MCFVYFDRINLISSFFFKVFDHPGDAWSGGLPGDYQKRPKADQETSKSRPKAQRSDQNQKGTRGRLEGAQATKPRSNKDPKKVQTSRQFAETGSVEKTRFCNLSVSFWDLFDARSAQKKLLY